MKISDLLAQSIIRLEKAGVSNSKLDTLVLLTHALSVSKERIIFYPDFEPDSTSEKKFLEFIERRSKREPVSHIIGCREFYGYNFNVTDATLDPRPDSETLIETVLKKIPDRTKDFKILELGTGTGCLIITLLKLYPNAHGTGIDLSTSALEICQKNANQNEVAPRLNLKNSDLFTQLTHSEKFELIISNPPYIPSNEIANLQTEVRVFEPHMALDGGADGLDFYRKIAQNAADFLQPSGDIVVEIGAGQKEDVVKIFTAQNFIFTDLATDLAGIERVLCFTKSFQINQ